MRSKWEVLHRDLVRSVGTKESEQRFVALRSRTPAIARFERPQALIDYLAHVGGDLDEKDHILVQLALAAQVGWSGRLPMALILLGLWPGLDAAFGRLARRRQERSGELEAEIVARFADQVRRLDPQRVNRVAATLVRSTEREVVRGRQREVNRRRRISRFSVEAIERRRATAFFAHQDSGSAREAAANLCPTVIGGSSHEEITALRSWLAGLVGADADFVVDAVLLNRSRQELGAERGIDERAARKRLQRALVRVRRCLEAQISVSRAEGEVAFAPS